MLNYWLAGSQEKHGLSSKGEVVPEVLTVGGHQLTVLLTVDLHILSRKEMELCTSTLTTMLNKESARILKMFRHTVGLFLKVASRKSRLHN